MKNILFLLLAGISLQAFSQQDSATFYFNKGLEEKAARRYLPATRAFEKAIGFNSGMSEAYMENAMAYTQMRKLEFAKNNYLKVYEMQPGNQVVIKELAEMYYNFRQYPKAIEFAQKCKGCENTERIIGMSYYRQEDYPAAEKALKATLIKNPADAEATYTLARTYLDMEEYAKSVPYYEKAVNMEGANNNWMYELGLLYYNNNNFKSAVNAFDLAAKNGYNQTNDFNENYGYAALYSGNYNKGEQLLNEIYRRKPGNKDVLRDMADIFYKQKQYDKSLEYCQKLMELDAQDGKALYQAGLNFQKKGQKDRGQQMCDKAITMDPSLESLRKKKEMPGAL